MYDQEEEYASQQLPPRYPVEIDNKYVEPDEKIRKYGFTRESKQTKLSKTDALMLENLGDCKSLTKLLGSKIATDDNPEPLKDLIDWLESKQAYKTLANCGLDGFTAKLGRTQHQKITESVTGSIEQKGKRNFLNRFKNGGEPQQ